MEYVVELVKALAWPVVVIWLGYIFRSELRQLFGRVSTLKYGDAVASFEQSLDLIQQLRQLRNKASHLPDFAITQLEAERYLDLAIKSARVIDSTTN
jgi:hypothetical protein